MDKRQVTMTINGSTVSGEVEDRTLLIHFLREQLNITGPHIGCDTSHCGACTVDMDGKSIKSCTLFAVQAEGADITTVEGLVEADGSLGVIQNKFREHHGLQCGFCTPGLIIAAQSMLNTTSDPSEEDIRLALSGNLCLCTGYTKVFEAVHEAATVIRDGQKRA